MYFHLMRETEKALQILIRAQQECEEAYLSFSQKESEIQLLIPRDPHSGESI